MTTPHPDLDRDASIGRLAAAYVSNDSGAVRREMSAVTEIGPTTDPEAAMQGEVRENFDFVEWFVGYVMSPEASTRLAGYCRRYGLGQNEADDVRSEWFLRVMRTVGRSGLPHTLTDSEEAKPYVLKAARFAAHDMGCRGSFARVDVRDARDLEAVLEPAGMPDIVEGIDSSRGWHEAMRSAITARFYANAVSCAGCRTETVVQLALQIVSLFAEDEAAAMEGPMAAGGSTVFSRLLYRAIKQTSPDRYEIDDSGRIAARTRAHKHRCEPCVIKLILAAVTDVADGLALSRVTPASPAALGDT